MFVKNLPESYDGEEHRHNRSLFVDILDGSIYSISIVSHKYGTDKRGNINK